jgi:DNA polymerase-3 subunit delta
LLYILYGEDDFSLKEELNRIKQELGDKDMLVTNTNVFSGQHIIPEQLIATCDTLPFLAPKRLVIVEGLLSRFEPQDKDKRSAKPKDTGWSTFKDYIQRMPESTVLILIDGKLKRNNHMLSALEPAAKIKEFKALRRDSLKAWIESRVTRMGCSISPKASNMVAELIGGNLWLLSMEIDKLCLYAQGRRIEEKDVKSLVSSAQETRVFDMVDALLDRKATTAIKLLHRLEDEGAVPPYLLFMITRQLRMVMQAKESLQQNQKFTDDSYIPDPSSDFALKKARQQARQHSMEQLKEIYRRLLDADVSIKTGKFKGDSGELSLDLLVCELCQEKA